MTDTEREEAQTKVPAADPARLRTELIPNLLRTMERGLVATDGSTALLDAVLADAWAARATDVHIDPMTENARIRFRVDGVLVNAGLITRLQASRIINQFKTLANIDPVALFFPVEARLTHEMDSGSELDLRVTLAPTMNGEKLALRVLDPASVSKNIEDLGFSNKELSRVRNWLQHLSGMFLVTGPTGSGKTTTLYALLHELKERNSHIVTIEDPPEYRLDGINQIAVNEKHGLTFAEGLKVTLRMDPDFLMIGEIREHATAKVAADAAVAGRVLLSTIHARDVVSAVTTLRNRGLGDHEIATALTAVVNQRLVRKLCPSCCRKDTPSAVEAEWFKNIGHKSPENVWRAVGCDACATLGYIGRTGIYEVWHLEEDDLALILRHADEHHLRTHMAGKDHRSLANNAIEKVAHGITTIDELQALTGLLPGGALREDGSISVNHSARDDTDAKESPNVAV